jgi:hypothetical protein
MESKCKLGAGKCVLLAATLMFLCGVAAAEDYVWIDSGVADVNETIGGYLIISNATVTLLADAHIVDLAGDGDLYCLEGSNVNITGGVIEGWTYIVADANVTVYGNAFAVDGNDLDPGTPNIYHPGPSFRNYTLSGTYADGTAFSMKFSLDPGAQLKLQWGELPPQPAPDIVVYPDNLTYDFGDVAVGDSNTVVVQIGNAGDADLQVTALTLTGSGDFAMTDGPAVPFTVAPSQSIVVDVQVTFTPSGEGLVSATLIIASDDADEPSVEVTLIGVGVIVEQPPQEQIQQIVDVFEGAVELGTLVGYGPGNKPENRLKAFGNMLDAVSDLINAEDYAQALEQLQSIEQKCDGDVKPPDFVVGEAAADLHAAVVALIEDLSS